MVTEPTEEDKLKYKLVQPYNEDTLLQQKQSIIIASEVESPNLLQENQVSKIQASLASEFNDLANKKYNNGPDSLEKLKDYADMAGALRFLEASVKLHEAEKSRSYIFDSVDKDGVQAIETRNSLANKEKQIEGFVEIFRDTYAHAAQSNAVLQEELEDIQKCYASFVDVANKNTGENFYLDIPSNQEDKEKLQLKFMEHAASACDKYIAACLFSMKMDIGYAFAKAGMLEGKRGVFLVKDKPDLKGTVHEIRRTESSLNTYRQKIA
jgi:hypothetical protein